MISEGSGPTYRFLQYFASPASTHRFDVPLLLFLAFVQRSTATFSNTDVVVAAVICLSLKDNLAVGWLTIIVGHGYICGCVS